ncbi:MAG: hypothetical protein ABI946_03425 [Chthoniobacterales bacterium]
MPATQVAATQVAATQVAATQVAAHQVAAHQVAAHQVAAPQVTVPQVTVPQVTVPQVAVPQVAVPQVIVPQVAVPQVAISVDSATIKPRSSRLGENLAFAGIVSAIFYVPIAALFSLINPSLGWAVACVGATAVAGIFLMVSWPALPVMLMLFGGLCAIGGMMQHDVLAQVLVGAAMAAVGFIWNQFREQR